MEGDGKVRRLRQACVDEYAQRVDEPLGRGMGTVAVTGDVRALSTHASFEPLSIGHGDASANAGGARLKASVKAQSMGVDSAPEPESA